METVSPPLFVPPGHFYSPVVDPSAIAQLSTRLFDPARTPPGIDLRESAQLAFLPRVRAHCIRLPFHGAPHPGLRYHYENPAYSYGDGITLASMLMEHRPRRMIEIGSGFSSALTLDIVERFLDWRTACVFIEPYPDLLFSLLQPTDRERISVHVAKIQDANLAVFDPLEAGDILFIDSTHVLKTGSDVAFYMTEVLPRLKPGVLVHFHDVFWPFEYPRHWVIDENRSWNELYWLQAFLTNNREWEVLFFNHFLAQCHAQSLYEMLPLYKRNPGGAFWMRKLATG